jgi:hypothetical protein
MLVPLLLAVDFMNFTYTTNPCSQNVPVPVVMRRGKFTYSNTKMGVDFDVYVHSVTRGSLKAGTHQDVVVLACDFPVGGVSSAYVFDERGNTAVRLAQVATGDWGGDWGGGPSSIHVRFAHNVLYVTQCKNSECTERTSSAYALRRGKLAKLH